MAALRGDISFRYLKQFFLVPLEMHFFFKFTAFGYSNNQWEATLLQNVK